VAGPQITPHVVAQQHWWLASSVRLKRIGSGRYRLQMLNCQVGSLSVLLRMEQQAVMPAFIGWADDEIFVGPGQAGCS
jgi:hypothetical protein